MVGTAMFGEGRNGRYCHVWCGAKQGGLGDTAMFGAGRNRVDWEIPSCLVKGETGWIGRYRHVW